MPAIDEWVEHSDDTLVLLSARMIQISCGPLPNGSYEYLVSMV